PGPARPAWWCAMRSAISPWQPAATRRQGDLGTCEGPAQHLPRRPPRQQPCTVCGSTRETAMTTRQASVVIGANYGDEGKGVAVDRLTSETRGADAVVIRFNGGAQAGHTVTLDDGRRHVFS